MKTKGAIYFSLLALIFLLHEIRRIGAHETANETTNGIPKKGVRSTIELKYALLLILGFGLFTMLVAMAFHFVRKFVYNDANNLDTTFDAGGKVSIGLTATAIVSQWTWSATLLQSSTVASKYGISGPFWYGAGATVHIVLFAILSIQLKTRAPGAKTFLQVIRARFGKPAHIIYCVFAGFTNIIVTMQLLLAGTAVITSLVQNLSLELASMILAAIIGSYTMIGGLGATFYVSYFNTTLIFTMMIILVVEVFYNPTERLTNPLGSSEKMYFYLNATTGPDGNEQNSYLTFLSSGGLMFGIINILGNFGTVFCDQSYWQSSVAAKPFQGVWGFIAGGLTWFAIPFTLATTTGLAYLALGTERGTTLLVAEDVDRGLVAPAVAQVLLGTMGKCVMLFLILMAVTSTGSAEVIAVASIIVYDIYQIYVRPFRKDFNIQAGYCVFCGNKYSSEENSGMEDGVVTTVSTNGFSETPVCQCPDVTECKACAEDTLMRSKKLQGPQVREPYTCRVHGLYRQYQDGLLNYKSWCILWVSIFTIPLVLFTNLAGLNLGWVYLFTGVLIACTVIPVSLSLLWSGVTNQGMISGVLVGCAGGLASWLGTSSTYEGGLQAGYFLKNTYEEVSMLVGNGVSFVLGGAVCILVSLCTINRKEQTEHGEWEKLRNIENPLHPWAVGYADDFDIKAKVQSKSMRPTQAAMKRAFRGARLTAYIVGTFLAVGLVIVWPAVMTAIKVLNLEQFRNWTIIAQAWAFTAAAFIISVPLAQEIYGICSHVMKSKKAGQ